MIYIYFLKIKYNNTLSHSTQLVIAPNTNNKRTVIELMNVTTILPALLNSLFQPPLHNLSYHHVLGLLVRLM